MKITALVENKSTGGLKARHGLSLYIETKKHKILFDLGPDNTLFYNSDKLGLDLRQIDTVIISHGHLDHGGALEKFLKINQTAKIYIQKKAFEKHFLKVLFLKINVGINPNLSTNPQFVLLDGDYTIDDELKLFTVENIEKCYSEVNSVIYAGNEKDNFSHEQNLVITESSNALIMGCGHAGVVNILEKAQAYKPKICIGGYHLENPVTKKSVSYGLLEKIAREMNKYNIRYYTCHCTGKRAFNYLAQNLPDMNYFSCGEALEI